MPPTIQSAARRSNARWVGFQPREISALKQRQVVREHASEAAWLWQQRERAVRAPHYRLFELGKLDARVLAHLRGMEVAGEDGRTAIREALERVDAGAVFVFAYLAFSATDAAAMRHALRLAAIDGACEAAVAAALGWNVTATVQGPLLRLATSPVALHRRLALVGLVAHRVPCESIVVAGLRDLDATLRSAGCAAIGELGLVARAPLLAQAQADAEACVRMAAAKAAVRCGLAAAVPALFEEALAQPQPPRAAIELAIRHGGRDWTCDALRRLVANPAHRRLAIHAAGAAGEPASLPWLLETTCEVAHARTAGEAVAMITGADLRYLNLHRDAPEDAGELDEHPDDQHLVWPDPVALGAWCERSRGARPSGDRLLCGVRPTPDACARVLRDGYQRQRAAAAIELARHERSRPLFDVRRRADWQRRHFAS